MLVSLDLQQDIDAHSVTGSLEIRGYLFGFDTTCRTARARDGYVTIGGLVEFLARYRQRSRAYESSCTTVKGAYPQLSQRS